MFKYAIVATLLIALILNLAYLSTGTLSPKEVGLLSTLLALVSIAGSWVIAHIYGQHAMEKAIQDVKEIHQSNLRTYALNASEKVNNLSRQLDRLAGYMQDALTINYEDNPKTGYAIGVERISSAVHILETLKSVNDTTLSDWSGVIGEELEEQKEERDSKQAELREVLERLQNLETGWNNELFAQGNAPNTPEIKTLRNEVANLTRQVTGSSVIATSNYKRVEATCPNCDFQNSYSQHSTRDNNKNVQCRSCNKNLVSNYNVAKQKATLEAAKLITETIDCSQCGTPSQWEINTRVKSKVIAFCDNCSTRLALTRIATKIRVKALLFSAPKSIDPKLIERVENALPKQPWPTGTHKIVQNDLDISSSEYSSAVNCLIARGQLKLQVDSKLFDTQQDYSRYLHDRKTVDRD